MKNAYKTEDILFLGFYLDICIYIVNLLKIKMFIERALSVDRRISI